MRKTKVLISFFWLACVNSVAAFATAPRIITLSSALTETVDALGLGSSIVATDVTSEYPGYVKKLPKVSRNRAVSIEGLMMYRPDIVLAPEADISKSVAYQLKKTGIRLELIQQEFSAKGAAKFITRVAQVLNASEKAATLLKQTETDLQHCFTEIKNRHARELKVLFIYARGTGVMSVAGKGSNMDAMIQMAGAKNAVQEFADFKPYSTEAMIKANPDAILLFDFGASSLGGKAAILKMPGVMLTNAGKQKNIIEVDGPLMVNFSSRLPAAVKDLHYKLYP